MRPYLVVTVLLLTGISCNGPGPTDKGAAPSPVTTVKIVKPQMGSLARVIEQPATMIADREAPLYAKLPGYVKKYYFDIGQQVNGPKSATTKENSQSTEAAGDVIAEISIPELSDEAREKAARKRQAETEVRQSQQLWTVAKENVNALTAQANEARFAVKRAEATFNRWESEKLRIAKLVSDRTIEPQIGEETINQYLAAEAAYNEAKSRVITAEAMVRRSEAERDKAEADVEVAQAKLQVAQSETDRLGDLLQYTKIRAPFDGIVTQRNADVGHFVRPAGDARSIPLFTVVGIDVVRVVVEVPEADAALVKLEDEAQITIPALKSKPVVGRVSRTAGSLQPTSRTLRVEIDLPNRDRMFKVGMYANVRIKARLPAHYLLPTTAVATSGDGTVCYLVEGDKLRRIFVQVGRSDGASVEVLKKQVSGTDDWQDWTGEEVVAARGTQYLTDGQTVAINVE